MRHGKKVNHLSRKKAHRVAMLSNMAASLFLHKRINTTLAKAKALRLFAEPLVTKAKANTTHARRIVYSYMEDKAAIQELFGVIREKVGDRPGGYVRVIRTGIRQGDGAETAMIELVDFNMDYTGGSTAKTAAAQKRKTRRGKAKSATAEKSASPKAKAKAGATTDDVNAEGQVEAEETTEGKTESEEKNEE